MRCPAAQSKGMTFLPTQNSEEAICAKPRESLAFQVTVNENFGLAALTPRQRQIMQLVLAGHPSKNIAADLAISRRTVENHRASIMKKTGSASLPALARLALAASWTGDGEPAAA
jgi:FixJ family two-component response regulator